MTVACIHLEPLLNEAIQLGAKVSEVSEGWGKVNRVVLMVGKMPSTTGAHTVSNPALRTYKNHGTPHNAADEGVICDACGVAISFPSEGAP